MSTSTRPLPRSRKAEIKSGYFLSSLKVSATDFSFPKAVTALLSSWTATTLPFSPSFEVMEFPFLMTTICLFPI